MTERTAILNFRGNSVVRQTSNMNRHYSVVNNHEKRFRNTEKIIQEKKTERNKNSKNLSILYQNVNTTKARAIRTINNQAKPNINALTSKIKQTNTIIKNKKKELSKLKNGNSEYRKAKRSIKNMRKEANKTPALRYNNRVPQKRGFFGRMYDSAGNMYQRMRGKPQGV